MLNISNFVPEASIIRNAKFSTLGYVDSDAPGLLAFADSVKYVLLALQNKSLAVLITTPELASLANKSDGLIISDNPRELFYNIHRQLIASNYYKNPFKASIGENCAIHPTAIISPYCRIGNNVTIAEYTIVRDNVSIGDGVVIEPRVTLGVDGILYNKSCDNVATLIPHAGSVIIEDNAILMTNSVVVRSIHDTDITRVGRGALIGLGTVVGHDAKVEAGAIVSNQCVIARRSVVGKNAFIGTNSMIKEHVIIGENAKVMAGSVVITNVAKNETVSGNFATSHKTRMLVFLRSSKNDS